MKVSGEVNAGREYALLVLTLGLTIELLPPFADIMQLGLVVHHDFDLLATLVERIAHSGILCCGILFHSDILATGLFHLLRTLYQRADVKAGASNGQQADGREHREATTHIVGNDETLIALFVRTTAGSTTLGIRHGHNHLLGLLLTALGLALLLQQAERQGGLSRRAAL